MLLDAAEFRAAWTFNALARLPEGSENPGIPDEAFRFLQEAGLPTRTPIGVRFSPLNSGIDQNSFLTIQDKEYFVLGYGEYFNRAEIVIDREGCIFEVHIPPYNGVEIQMIHRSIAQFASCLLIFTQKCIFIPAEIVEKTRSVMSRDDFEGSEEELYFLYEYEAEVKEMMRQIDVIAPVFWEMSVWEMLSGGLIEEARCVAPEEFALQPPWPDAARYLPGRGWCMALGFTD